MKLYKRKVFDKIEPYLGDETIVVLHGARQVGKTHILFYIRDWLLARGEKVFYYDLEYPELLGDLNKGVDVFVSDLAAKGYTKGEEVYALIDEIQYLENPSSFLKIIADHYKNIHLVISGSSTFDIKTKFKNSLVGRTTSFEIFPLSFKEYLEFKEIETDPSLVSNPSGIANLKMMYSEFVKYGGYPKVVLEDMEEKKKRYLLQLVDTYIRKDIRDLAKVEDINKFNNMLKVLASQSGQLLDMGSLSREVNLSLPTLSKYLSILEETFVIKRISPYSRSPSVEISKNPKVFLFDSGLQSIIWLNSFQGSLLGTIFETSVFGELVKIFGRSAIHFWRTKTQSEIDFIVEKDTGLIIPIEVKTNFQQFSPKTIKLFCKKYGVKDWMAVGLNGAKVGENEFYPWEL